MFGRHIARQKQWIERNVGKRKEAWAHTKNMEKKMSTWPILASKIGKIDSNLFKQNEDLFGLFLFHSHFFVFFCLRLFYIKWQLVNANVTVISPRRRRKNNVSKKIVDIVFSLQTLRPQIKGMIFHIFLLSVHAQHTRLSLSTFLICFGLIAQFEMKSWSYFMRI